MNYIKQLQSENCALALQLDQTRDMVTQLMAYACSTKFQGAGNDYMHISTDLMGWLMDIRNQTQR